LFAPKTIRERYLQPVGEDGAPHKHKKRRKKEILEESKKPPEMTRETDLDF
jgi:hypothetical protein